MSSTSLGSALDGALDPNLVSVPLNHFPSDLRHHNNENAQLQTELKSSVTLVIWYKAKMAPIMLQQMIPTFPLFQLSRCSSLAKDLGLGPTTYLDTYIPAQRTWEQHTISSVREVESNQRLLYRVRISLLDGLQDADCPRLLEEVSSQHSNINTARPAPTPAPAPFPISVAKKKRPATEPLDSSPPLSKQRITTATPTSPADGKSSTTSKKVVQPLTPITTPTSSNSPSAPGYSDYQSTNVTHFMHQSPLKATPSDAITSAPVDPVQAPQTLEIPIPHHPHPPLKRWPNDYTAVQISRGFDSMDRMCSSYTPLSPSIEKSSEKQQSSGVATTQKVAFERVFGSRYVKSTVCRHRGLWKRAAQELKSEFQAKDEHDESGIWAEFVKRAEGRTVAGTFKIVPSVDSQV